MRRLFLLLPLLLMGCVQPQQGTPTAPSQVENAGGSAEASINQAKTKLQAITSADLNQAIDLATQAEDPAAVQCYTYLRDHLVTMNGQASIVPHGVFSAFQLARNGVRKVKGGVSDELNLACAALYQSAKGDVLSIAALVGRIAGTGGIGALIPGF